MNWKTLMQDIPYQVIGEGSSEEITSIEYDSRKVKPGSAFVAVVGGAFDVHDFIAQAAKAGAVLAVVEKELEEYGFVRCHQGFLVNLQHVQAVEENEARCSFGNRVPVSNRMHQRFLETLEQYRA